jgi:hypothetical protein
LRGGFDIGAIVATSWLEMGNTTSNTKHNIRQRPIKRMGRQAVAITVVMSAEEKDAENGDNFRAGHDHMMVCHVICTETRGGAKRKVAATKKSPPENAEEIQFTSPRMTGWI